MVYTVVLEATAARIESSSLSLGTKLAGVVEWYTRGSKKPVPKGLGVRVSSPAPHILALV